MAYQYTPAFIAFCGGAALEEIAEEFKIPLKSLQARARQEGWRSLANRISCRMVGGEAPSAEALNRLEANRLRNYETAAKLREHLMDTVEKLRAGTLRIKKQSPQKGQVVEYETLPGPADWLNIATYARIVADLTYRALGDHEANGGHKADASAGTPPPATPFTVVLPSVIARPRFERSATVECDAVAPDDGNGAMPLALQAPP